MWSPLPDMDTTTTIIIIITMRDVLVKLTTNRIVTKPFFSYSNKANCYKKKKWIRKERTKQKFVCSVFLYTVMLINPKVSKEKTHIWASTQTGNDIHNSQYSSVKLDRKLHYRKGIYTHFYKCQQYKMDDCPRGKAKMHVYILMSFFFSVKTN